MQNLPLSLFATIIREADEDFNRLSENNLKIFPHSSAVGGIFPPGYKLLHGGGVLLRGGMRRVGVLAGAEQPGGIVGHHAGLHISGQKFPGVLLAAGRRGAVGHGYAVGCTVRAGMGRAAGLLHLRGHLRAGGSRVAGHLHRFRLFAQRRAAAGAAVFRRGGAAGPVFQFVADERIYDLVDWN